MERRTLSNIRNWLLLANYFVGYVFIYPIITSILAIVFPTYEKIFYLFLYVVTLVINVILAYPLIKDDLKDFWNNCFDKTKNIVKYALINFGIEIVIASIIFFFYKSESVNQKGIEELLNTEFLLTALAAIIFAPIVEESVFRLGILNKLQDRIGFKWALLISCIAFGFIHVLEGVLTEGFKQAIYIFYYGGIGLSLGLLYRKNGDIISCILLHLINNLVALIAIL